jgi:phosphoribosylanthranilate isomerase
MIKVKICGITNIEDALLASKYGADVLGFIFAKKSPRCIKKETAKKIIKELDPFIMKAGIFADEKKENVLDIARDLNLDILQFHGDETPGYCNEFRSEYKVIKTVFSSCGSFSKTIDKYCVDAYLADIRYEDKKNGQNMLSADALKELGAIVKKGKNIIISGGLTDKNLNKIKKIKPYAVDVASGIEKLIGKKDERKMELFIKKAKDCKEKI